MSQENVEVVREAVDALNAGNRERLFRVFHPEMGAVHQLRDGKSLRVDTYLDQRDALEAAGLRE